METSATLSHPEWSQVNSLTSPADRGGEMFKAHTHAPVLNENETSSAMKALYDTSIKDNYPELERQFVDPPIQLQRYGLISFVPSKGATPDKDGFYGFAKLRGHYESEQEAQERAEFLIKSVDSYHTISMYHVGRPVPITIDSKFAARVAKVDLKTKTVNTLSEDVKQKRAAERAEIEEIKNREKKLLEEGKPDYVEDPYETYTTLRVKKAQLCWTYDKTIKQLEKVKESIIKAREDIAKMDSENPDLQTQHIKRYMEARKQAGISDEYTTEDNYLKYFVEDIDLGF
jgi:hypothetical protein